MNAVTVIENLIKLGTIVGDAAAKYRKDGEFDFVAFLAGKAPKDLQEVVSSLISALKPDDLKKAIAATEKKQRDLLNGKSLGDLGTDKLIQYAALTDTKLLLETARLKRAIEGDFYSWLLDGGLAGIIRVAAVVVPLLV